MDVDMSIILAPWNLFWAALGVVVIAFFSLSLIERRLHNKVAMKKHEAESAYRAKLAALKNAEKNPEHFLLSLDKLAREYANETLELKKNLSYEEIIALFNKKKNLRAAQFFEKLQKTLYSGGQLRKEELMSLSKELSGLVRALKKREGDETRRGDFLQKIYEIRTGIHNIGKIREAIETVDEQPKDVVEAIAKIGEEVETEVERLAHPAIKPHKEIKIEFERRKNKRLENYDFVKSVDDLARIKEKLKMKKIMRAVDRGARAEAKMHELV